MKTAPAYGRSVGSMEKPRICRTCVLPESDVFPLDDSGECSLCGSPSLLRHISKNPDPAALERVVAALRDRGKGRTFDCIVDWSGGRDSTYMLHQLVTVHRLRCAAVFGRTPFTPAEIIANVRAIAAELGVTLIETETPPDHRDVAAYCLKEYVRTRKPILINLACASCKFVNREIFRHARRLKIKTVIYGGNRFEYFPAGPASIDIDTEDRYSFITMLRDNLLRLFKGAGVLAASPALLRHLGTFFKASVLYVNQYTVFLRLKNPGIFRFDYFHYAEWDEKAVNAVLVALGWKLPPGCTSTWRADCVFEAVRNTAFRDRLGFIYAQAMYSNLIRAGQMTRDEALVRLMQEGISEPRLHEALRICGLPEDMLDNG